ncbi:MAG: Gfo/Idh/MocA family oxidoreductase [Lewinella sp.]
MEKSIGLAALPETGEQRHTVGIIMNGVTGRMGTNQHLLRSIVAIREQGGVATPEGGNIYPEPILVGRNMDKLRALGERTGINRMTADLDEALADNFYQIYFDAQITGRRHAAVKKAIAAGKHVYCEKPTGTSLEEALDLYHLAESAGVKHGVVQDKLWLPGLRKLKRLMEADFFGDILSVRGDFGYWVFEGTSIPAQRPSWNYRKQDDGGIMVDMLCHWRYALDNLFGDVKSVFCLGATHIPKRVDERGETYSATADDAAYAVFELAGGVVAQFNSSWVTRVRRDDLLTIQVDGTRGSAVAGLRDCRIQHYGNTPKPVWNPDIPQPIDFYEDWATVPEQEPFENAFKIQWELFLKHVVLDTPFPYGLLEGAKGVQLAELGLKSWEARCMLPVEDLNA